MGDCRRDTLEGRDRAIVNRTNIGTVSAAIGETSERRGGWSEYGLSRALRYIFNRTELN